MAGISITGLPGGALKTNVGANAASASVIDLSAFIGQRVKIWSDDGDLWFSFAPDGGTAVLVVAGDQAASDTALIGDRAAQSLGVMRRVSKAAPFIVVAHVSATGVVRIKRVAVSDGSEA